VLRINSVLVLVLVLVLLAKYCYWYWYLLAEYLIQDCWTLMVQTCCLEPVLNTRAQACSEAFWRPRESHSMTSWCLGRNLHCPVLSMKGQKSRLPWNAVKRSWRQLVVKTCDDVHDWQGVSDEDFDGADDGESTTMLQASGRGSFAATRKKSSYPSDWQTELKRNCASLQPTVWEYFVTLS